MKNKLLLWILLIASLSSQDAVAQLFCYPCKDSTKQENIFFSCYQDYNPVCGCDGKTYRNDCFAINKYAFYPCGYFNGICGNFDVDISPNYLLVDDDQLNMQVFNRTSGYLSVNIFNCYGRLQYQGVFPLVKNVGTDGTLTGPSNIVNDISTITWDKGLYIVELIFDGERKIFKIVKGASKY